MIWMFGAVFLLGFLGVFAFVLTRPPVKPGRNTESRSSAPVAGGFLAGQSGLTDRAATEAEQLNILAEKKLPETAKESKSELLPRQSVETENDGIADALGEIHKHAVLPQAPKAYLRMVVEQENSVDRLLNGRIKSSYTLPPREFRIEQTEERNARGERPPQSPQTQGEHTARSPGLVKKASSS